jgi:hypothetical protein
MEKDGDNYVLSGSGPYMAFYLAGAGWTDYSIQVKVKLLIEGGFFLCFRTTLVEAASISYSLSVHPDALFLSKQLMKDYFGLTEASISLDINRWHTIKVTLNGTRIKVYVDDELKINYVDDDLPIIAGSIAFEPFENSHVHIDDILVKGG